MRTIIGLAVLAALLPLSSQPANAAFTFLNYYHLGEADPGAVAGGMATNSVDSVGSINLVLTGAPVYSSDVPANSPITSTLSLAFNGSNYALGPVLPTPMYGGNYGIEVWVKPASLTVHQPIVYNGQAGYNGYGIVQSGNIFQGLLGGVSFVGSVPVATNQWTELALVFDDGNWTFYENYNAVYAITTYLIPPAVGFAVATDPGAPTGGFQGLIDEVRTFDFVSFDITNLLSTNLPPINPVSTNLPPSPFLTMNMGGENALALSWPQTNGGFGLQYSSDLVNWTNVLADVTNGFCQVMDRTVPGGSRFYRLKYPFGTVGSPTLPPNGSLTYGEAVQSPFTQRATYGGIDYYGNPSWSFTLDIGGDQGHASIDASQVIDPEACTNGSLSFEWHLSDPYGSYYSSYGYDIFPENVTGYLTPRLDIGSLGLASGGLYSVRLYVFRKSDQALFATDMEIFVTDGYTGPPAVGYLPNDRIYVNPVVYPSGLQPDPF